MPTRRKILHALNLGGGALLLRPRLLFAAPGRGRRRFVFIIQRGAADGLAIVPPLGDPAYAGLRGALVPEGAVKLDAMFALHPALAETAKMYAAREALFVQAVASPYRERSHFDGQNVLETGGGAPYTLKDGWLNRLAALLPDDGEHAIAFAATVPLALRGKAAVTSYAPSALPQASDDLLTRVGMLYAGDAQLHALWDSALAAQALAGDAGGRRDAASLGATAASFLLRPDGPRIAMIETGGWDTHSGQNGRLAAQLKSLDALLAALKAGMGAQWADTVVLVATEFGRTAAANGTGGTDHGTGAAAMLVGGAVQGGRVIADWPGLARGALLDGRDLKPTLALDNLIAGAVAACFALEPARTADALFAQAGAARPLEGLVTRT
ncbi:DUF1501 domain-containing protein [Solimonas soli]|uniref:DUF1501 domain-containing protein n=1 Tax=Solimonas soli TaxID=413479 RepID=UPI000488DA66|nr:DUF1501 domain-containing protein [Solimonas soli]